MPSQKKILVVTQHFWPENFRINDIVEGFLQDGIAVDVLCGLPNYPKGEWFPGYSAAGPFEEEWHGARLYRCKEVPRRGNTSVNIFLNYVSCRGTPPMRCTACRAGTMRCSALTPARY